MKLFYLTLMITTGLFSNLKNKGGDESDLYTERLSNHVNDVKQKILSESKYNTKIAFFIDMKIKSGKNRFFIYDLENNKILDEGLVANGSGSEIDLKGNLKFSNEPNSKATSLGKYSIGKHYSGKFGKAYKLYGLEESNSNAFTRNIVLHYYSAVPYEEQDYYISNSQGCPMINEVFFKRIEKFIDASQKNIILDIYY